MVFTYAYETGSNRLASVSQFDGPVRTFGYTVNGDLTYDSGTAGTREFGYSSFRKLNGYKLAGTNISSYASNAFLLALS